MTSILQSKVRTVVVGRIRFWLLFTVLYFLKHFVKFIERILWNDSVIRQSVRGPVFLDHGVYARSRYCVRVFITPSAFCPR